MQSDTVIRRIESLPEISTSGKRINGLFRLMGVKDATHSYIRGAYPTTEPLEVNKNGEPDDGKLSSPVRRKVHGCSLRDTTVPILPYRYNCHAPHPNR